MFLGDHRLIELKRIILVLLDDGMHREISIIPNVQWLNLLLGSDVGYLAALLEPKPKKFQLHWSLLQA